MSSSSPTPIPGLRVQSLRFDRGAFTVASAKAWARAHGYRATNVRLTHGEIVLVQAREEAFAVRSLRQAQVDDGVRVVAGEMRSGEGASVEASSVPDWLVRWWRKVGKKGKKQRK